MRYALPNCMTVAKNVKKDLVCLEVTIGKIVFALKKLISSKKGLHVCLQTILEKILLHLL